MRLKKVWGRSLRKCGLYGPRAEGENTFDAAVFGGYGGWASCGVMGKHELCELELDQSGCFPSLRKSAAGRATARGWWLRNPVRVALAVREHELVESVLHRGGANGRTLCRVGLRSVEV